jgi:tRNA U34 2-thiouridine synthase MnmA/TrmU
MTKAIVLLSGGLDSILAAKMILEQGIELEAVNFFTVFCNCTTRGKTCLASKSAADRLGIRLKVFEVSREYFEIVKNPKYGYGSNINPCLDCRIFMFKKAGEYMREVGASFLVTGEVLGERPMSQRRAAMRIIERDVGLEGLIVRPLSAKLFESTIPEKEGLINREKLLAMQGRSRKPQIQLARELNINDYPCPAGGCLLTDSGFANRMRDLMKYKPDFTLNDIQLLKIGRHFRLTPEAKLVVGRDKEENHRLLNLAQTEDISFHPANVKGPIGIGRGIFDSRQLFTASRIIARYSDGALNQQLDIAYKYTLDKKVGYIQVRPLREEDLSQLRI